MSLHYIDLQASHGCILLQSQLPILVVISSTGSSQVLTSAVRGVPPTQHAEASPTLHDPDVRSFSFSTQPLRKRRSPCSNTPLYERPSLPCYGGARWDRTSMPSRPLCTTKAMPRVVSNVFCVPLSSLPTGPTDKAMPSARWMPTSYNAISPASRATVPGTCLKRPKGWAPSSDSSTNTASRAHGTRVFRPHLLNSGYENMTPILSRWPASLCVPARPMAILSDVSSLTVLARSHPTGPRSPRPGSRPLSARKPRGDSTQAANCPRSPSAHSSDFSYSAVPYDRDWRRRPSHRRSGS